VNQNINHGTVIQNTITINAIGNENIDYLLDQPQFHKFARSLIAGKRDGIAKLFALKHLNEDHPENQNVRKPKLKNPFVECFDGRTWTPRFYKDAMDDIMDHLRHDFESIVQKVFDENGRIDHDQLNSFMQEVGEPLSMDFTGDDYDWEYNMTDQEKEEKRQIIYLLVLEILYMKTRKRFIQNELLQGLAYPQPQIM